MREDIKEIMSGAILMMDVIAKGKDIPEAKLLVASARAGLVTLTVDLVNLPEEEEEEEEISSARKI